MDTRRFLLRGPEGDLKLLIDEIAAEFGNDVHVTPMPLATQSVLDRRPYNQVQLIDVVLTAIISGASKHGMDLTIDWIKKKLSDQNSAASATEVIPPADEEKPPRINTTKT